VHNLVYLPPDPELPKNLLPYVYRAANRMYDQRYGKVSIVFIRNCTIQDLDSEDLACDVEALACNIAATIRCRIRQEIKLDWTISACGFLRKTQAQNPFDPLLDRPIEAMNERYPRDFIRLAITQSKWVEEWLA
jgi:hypothetical protein